MLTFVISKKDKYRLPQTTTLSYFHNQIAFDTPFKNIPIFVTYTEKKV